MRRKEKAFQDVEKILNWGDIVKRVRDGCINLRTHNKHGEADRLEALTNCLVNAVNDKDAVMYLLIGFLITSIIDGWSFKLVVEMQNLAKKSDRRKFVSGIDRLYEELMREKSKK